MTINYMTIESHTTIGNFLFMLSTHRMDMGTSTLMAKMSELRLKREEADVTFHCNGGVIKAHSFILAMR